MADAGAEAPLNPLDTLPPEGEDQTILDLLHGMHPHPTAAVLIDAIRELGGLRTDWARQASTIAAMQARIDRLQSVIARLSLALAEAHVTALPAPEDAGAGTGAG